MVHPRVRIALFLFLILGLAAGASVFAQGSAPRAGAVVTDMQGTLSVQIGTNPPQSPRPGVTIPVGAMVRTGAKSGAMLVFPDGQICALGENSMFRIARYAYDPRDPSKNEMSLNLISGSLRCVMGDIAQSNPAAVRVQVGVVTVGVDATNAPRTDASAVVQGGSVAVTVQEGRVVVYLPSGQQQQLSAGQGMYLGEDGVLRRGTTAQLLQLFGQSAQGQEMQRQWADLQGYGQTIVTVATVPSALKDDSSLAQASEEKTAAAEFLKQLQSLPPTGATGEPSPPPAPTFGVAGTPATGGGGGGTPCAASCN